MKKIDKINQNNILSTLDNHVSMSTIPKKRGRKPKKRIEEPQIVKTKSNDNSTNSNNSTYCNDSAIILAIPSSFSLKQSNTDEDSSDEIEPDVKDKVVSPKKTNTKNVIKGSNKLVAKECTKEHCTKSNKSKKMTNDTENESLLHPDILHGIFQNDIPSDNVCRKCKHYQSMIETYDRKLKMYETKYEQSIGNKIHKYDLNFISYKTGNQVVLSKTHIKCWWDGYSFDNLPCFLPEYFANNTYYIWGCFCSFNCALAYNLYILRDSKLDQRKSLIYKIYKKIHNIPPSEIINIRVADEREKLVDYGGPSTIDEYRKESAKINEKYVMYMPPIRSLTITAELESKEKTKINTDDLVLKKGKPKNSHVRNSLFSLNKK